MPTAVAKMLAMSKILRANRMENPLDCLSCKMSDLDCRSTEPRRSATGSNS